MRSWNLSTKIIASYSVLIAVMSGTLASGMYWQLYSSQRQAIRNRLLAIVSLAKLRFALILWNLSCRAKS